MSKTARTAICAIPEARLRLLALGLALLAGACEGDRGPAGPQGPPGSSGGGGGGTDPDENTPTEYTAGEDVPALIARIELLEGASGPGGEFLVGDVMTVEFALEKADGSPWLLEELGEGEVLVSGPTSNYQRVLPAETDLPTRAEELTPGRYRFTFPDPLPSVFAPPYNDTTSFGPNGGDLGGRNLQDGTYTVGLSFTWAYTVDARPYQRVGETTLDFRVGTGAGNLTPRAVSSAEHCARCHGELRAHDGRYRKFELCLLCHTSGAEDANLPEVAGGTPGVTIDSRVIFHRIHAGRFLPSVNGVTSRQNGNRNYDAAPVPLLFVRSSGEIRDYSHVGFPAMPARTAPLPRDTGFANLTASQQAQEDLIRSGPTQCAACHGDPDGDGPIETPAQANVTNVGLRRACGACHDDIDFDNSYRANGQSMPPQTNDVGCNGCHDPRFPSPLSPIDGHRHPLVDPAENPGVNVDFQELGEGLASDGDGTLDPGETVRVRFELANDAGLPLDPDLLSELRFVLSGPTANFQVLYDQAIPTSLVEGLPPFDLVLPERLELEHVGDSGPLTDTFQTARAPHRLGSDVATRVFVRSSTQGGATTLTAAAARTDVSVSVADASGFARGDLVVLDDGLGGEEYLRVLLVEDGRLWFAAPDAGSGGLRSAHAAGASVLEIQVLEAQSPGQFTLDAATGTITEAVEFGAGRAVLVSYTTDFRVPASYPQALNGSADLDVQRAKWTGKPLVAGTYVGALVAARDFSFRLGTTSTPYRAGSPQATLSVLVGDATTPEPFTRIADGAACNTCHQELSYHEGLYRGFDACILCHGASGTEDLPRRSAPGAPATDGTSVEFRTLVHAIHRGRERLSPTYEVVARGPSSDPDAFTTRSYADYSTLPALPDRTLDCARCHGEGNLAALLPSERRHPSAQSRPLSVWRAACSGCHDAEAVTAHIESNTAPNGAEACAICHETGEFEDALQAHLAGLEPR